MKSYRTVAMRMGVPPFSLGGLLTVDLNVHSGIENSSNIWLDTGSIYIVAASFKTNM